MKTRLGVFIFVFLAGMILGATEPAVVHAGYETGGGSVWTPWLGTPPFGGTKLTGPLSVYFYVYPGQPGSPPSWPCGTGIYQGTMFYTVQFVVGFQIYTFDGTMPGVCLGNIGQPGSGGIGDVLMDFMENSILQIFPNATVKLKSIDNPGASPDGFGFVAEVTFAVKK